MAAALGQGLWIDFATFAGPSKPKCRTRYRLGLRHPLAQVVDEHNCDAAFAG
jgi:hypothetical protein